MQFIKMGDKKCDHAVVHCQLLQFRSHHAISVLPGGRGKTGRSRSLRAFQRPTGGTSAVDISRGASGLYATDASAYGNATTWRGIRRDGADGSNAELAVCLRTIPCDGVPASCTVRKRIFSILNSGVAYSCMNV